ncbi:MAG: hypothetical protein KDA93_22950 [Planctomycetaceae bacterium]|nr:hypothetical protein [Planctomycetaceae bacterium]
MTLGFADNAVTDTPLSVDEHGVIRIGQTGVLLESVVMFYRESATAEQIVQAFPALDPAEIHYVLGYSLQYRDQIDDYLASRAADEARVRSEVEGRFDVSALKARVQREREVT